MKAYIVGGGMDGTKQVKGVYHLVTADGVCWATQWCSSFDWAMKDLYEDRAGLQADWAEKYGSVEVIRLGEDDMTFGDLLAMEQGYPMQDRDVLPDGVYYSVTTIKGGKRHNSALHSIDSLNDLLIAALAEA